MTDYIEVLKKNDLKATIQRTGILKSIDNAGHINIDDIYEDVKENYPTLSLATIYKNIILMVKHGVIVEVPINGEKSKYELKKDDHIHLICKSCGEIEDKEITKEKKQILAVENFKLDTAQINLYGLCKKCQSLI
ncbi:MAG: transcriptional repressor [Epsilonproteobacteria bacterium]|nr:transcriptional repressor [Campylobacterota bacterium]